MANGHGGPRTPQNPAPASGPGRLAKRTDGPSQKLQAQTDQAYGDRTAILNQERQAGMSQSPSVTPAAVPAGGESAQAPTYAAGPFDGPSTQPNVPVTNGVAVGPGAGPEALGVTPPGQAPTGQLTNMLAGMSTTDTTGTLAKLYEMAKQRGV